MSNSHYTMDVDEYLVSLMAEHPSIYDKRNAFYKDYKKKQEAWEEIANTLNLDAESVKRRWENLRDRFVRVYREYTALSNNPIVRSKFRLFDQMLWLAPHIRKRRMTTSVFALKSATIPQLPQNEDTQESENQEKLNIKAETQSNCSETTYHESFLEEEAMLSSTSATETVTQSYLSNQNEDLNKSDHYFIMSVVHDCQNMPPRKKLKFKKDVLGLLEKYLYEDDK